MNDRQVLRLAAARQRYAEAQTTHREAVLELERAAAELTTAGAALAERLLLLQPLKPASPDQAHPQGALGIPATPLDPRCAEGAARLQCNAPRGFPAGGGAS